MKKAVQYLIIFAIGAGFLYVGFQGKNIDEIWTKIRESNPLWLFVGLGISIFSHFIRAWRATQFYSALGYKVGNTNSFLAVLISYMMNYFIPRAGEVSRCAVLKKTDDVPVEKSLGTVVAERTFDMILLLLILGLVFVLQFELLFSYIQGNLQGSGQQSSHTIVYFLLAIVFLFFLVAWFTRKSWLSHPFITKIRTILLGFADGLLSFRRLPNPLLFLAQSVAIWICYILMMYFCLFAMPATADLSFSACLTVFAIGTIGVVIPAPGAGAGTYHYAIMQSLLLFGVAANDGIAYATLVHGAQMLILIALGALSSLLVVVRTKK